MKIVAAVIGAAAIVAAPAAALANTYDVTEEITFSYSLDVDMLDTASGAATVYQDLLTEARKACTLAGVRGTAQLDQACVAELVEKVVATLNSPMLEAAYMGVDSAEEVMIAPLTVAER